MRSVQIVIISYAPEIHSQVKNACFAALGHLSERGYSVKLCERIGDCMIPRARNAVVSDFLQSGDDDLIMVDADNYCQPDGFEKLLTADADVVAAPCRGKKEQVTWPIRWLHEDLKIENGLLEVECVGTGIIRMSRKCLEAMADKFPWYEDDTCQAKRAPALFWYDIINGALWGEDLVFCQRWRNQGGKVFIVPDVTTWHIGYMHYQGSVTDWLKAVPRSIIVQDKATKSEIAIANPISQIPADPLAEHELTQRAA